MHFRHSMQAIATCLALVNGVALADTPAGIAAYACKNGSAVYLLAFDPYPGREGWGHLGGRSAADETQQETALREFHEESNCAFPITPDLAKRLRGPSLDKNGFATFALLIPYLAANQFATPRPCKDVERTQWVWVTHTNLHSALESSHPNPTLEVDDGPVRKIHLWSVSAEALRKARKDAVLPVRDPCAA